VHPRLLAQRQSSATARMMKAARKLARHHGLGKEARALEGAQARLPAVQMMMQSEAMADLLEAITDKMGELAEMQAAPDLPKVPDDAVGNVTVETVEIVPAAAEAEKPIGKDRKKKDG
jgi:hypothetical protein